MDEHDGMMRRSGPGNDSGRTSKYSWIYEQIAILEEKFDVLVSAPRKKLYAAELMEVPTHLLGEAFRRAGRELKFFPKIAELLALASEGDGRPGPEEAWAICPKNEDQTVIWTTEISGAWNSGVRNMLCDEEGNSDPIAARMLFKEKYTQLVARARKRYEPVRWTASLGWNNAARVGAVADGVHTGKITREHAFELIHPEHHEELEMALPVPGRPQLMGENRKPPVVLPGLAGLLANLRMEGTVPEGLDPKKSMKPMGREPLTEEQIAKRKEMLKAQAEQIEKRRKVGMEP